MSKTSFEELVNIMRPYLEKQVTGRECQIASFLYYIGDGTAIVRQQMSLIYHVVWCHL